MKLIAAVNNNWGIGKNNDLLYHIPSDMKFFRSKTKDNVIIIGRKTLESFPGGMPLKNRVNIVLTRDKSYKCADTVIVHSIEDIAEEIKKYSDKEIYLCGGEAIYGLLFPYCNEAYITKVQDGSNCDKYMVNLDLHPDWFKSEESDLYEEDGFKFFFCTYINKNVKEF